MSPRAGLRRAFLAAALLLMGGSLAGCNTMLTSAGRLLDPDKEYYQTFDGPYVDKVEKKDDAAVDANAVGAKGVRIQTQLASGVVDLPELEVYLNGIVDRLKAVSPRPHYPARVYLVPNSVFDAYATGDGAIFISLGVLRELKSEDELAVVLAHELAHLILDHHDLNALDDTSRVGAGAMTIGAGLSQGSGLQGYALIAGIARGIVEDIITPTFTRQQEDEADLLGVDLMIRAGYSLSLAVTTMERTANAESLASKAKAELEKRQMEAEREKLKQQPGPPGQVDPIQQIAAALTLELKHGLHTATADLRETHRPPEARMGSLQGYLNERYGDKAPSPPNRTSLAAALAEKRTSTILAAYDLAEQAYKKSEAGDAKGAQEAIRKALSGPASLHVRPREIAFSIELKRGNDAAALDHLKAVLRTPEAPLGFYKTLVDYYIGKKRNGEAFTYAQEASKRFDEPVMLWPQLIYLNKNMNRKTEAARIAVRCQTHAPDEIRQECAKMGEDKPLSAAGLSS